MHLLVSKLRPLVVKSSDLPTELARLTECTEVNYQIKCNNDYDEQIYFLYENTIREIYNLGIYLPDTIRALLSTKS